MFETFLFATDNGLKSVVFMVCSMEVGGGGALAWLERCCEEGLGALTTGCVGNGLKAPARLTVKM